MVEVKAVFRWWLTARSDGSVFFPPDAFWMWAEHVSLILYLRLRHEPWVLFCSLFAHIYSAVLLVFMASASPAFSSLICVHNKWVHSSRSRVEQQVWPLAPCSPLFNRSWRKSWPLPVSTGMKWGLHAKPGLCWTDTQAQRWLIPALLAELLLCLHVRDHDEGALCGSSPFKHGVFSCHRFSEECHSSAARSEWGFESLGFLEWTCLLILSALSASWCLLWGWSCYVIGCSLKTQTSAGLFNDLLPLCVHLHVGLHQGTPDRCLWFRLAL